MRAVALALLCPVLLVGGSAQADAFRCIGTQRVQAACCCPAAEASGGAEVSRACCEKIRADQSLPAASLHADAPIGLAQVAAIALLAGVWPPAAWVDAARDSSRQVAEHTRARAGPSLIVLHQRFLI